MRECSCRELQQAGGVSWWCELLVGEFFRRGGSIIVVTVGCRSTFAAAAQYVNGFMVVGSIIFFDPRDVLARLSVVGSAVQRGKCV